MLALLLAAVLAQASPVPDISPVASPNAMTPQSSAPAGTPTPGRVTFPRGPRRLPNEGPRMTTGDAQIHNSGSTNFAGYTIVVHADGTADVADGSGGTIRKTVGAPQVKWFFAHLKAAMPLDQLQGARCMKSASFGSSTTITFEGQTTPDLSCAAGSTSRELMRTAGVIADQVGAGSMHTIRRHVIP